MFWRTDFESIPWLKDTSKPFPGGWGPIDDAESVRAIHAGLDLGITLIDTSSSYGCGHSEEIIGRAIADRRDRVVIVTKFGNAIDEEKKWYLGHDASPDAIRDSCEASLRRLGTDVLDVFLLHWSGYDGPAEPIVEVLEDLIRAGKIRTYGWSNHRAELMGRFTGLDGFAVVEFPHSIFQRSPEMLALCEDLDLGALIRSPLGMGLLTGKFAADTRFPEDDIRHGWNLAEGRLAEIRLAAEELRDVLTADGRTLAQAALGWIWAQSERTVPIPGFKTVSQVTENAKAMEFGPLNAETIGEVDRILRARETHD
jgi:aryl-alcohol dehydrogenase-like predicted oxidoreductase